MLSLNETTNGYAGDWRNLYPGAGQVDAMGVDYFNHDMYATTAADFATESLARDPFGGPRGIETHRQFAQSVGLPLTLNEWSGSDDAVSGDAPAFIQGMHDLITQNAGTGAGKVLYAIQFNVSSAAEGKHNLLINSRMPASSAAYKKLFGTS